jgi:hypothetical protein
VKSRIAVLGTDLPGKKLKWYSSYKGNDHSVCGWWELQELMWLKYIAEDGAWSRIIREASHQPTAKAAGPTNIR